VAPVGAISNHRRFVGAVFEGKWGKRLVMVAVVVKDFRFQLFNNPSALNFLNVKVSNANSRALIAAMEAKWKILDPLHPMKIRGIR